MNKEKQLEERIMLLELGFLRLTKLCEAQVSLLESLLGIKHERNKTQEARESSPSASTPAGQSP